MEEKSEKIILNEILFLITIGRPGGIAQGDQVLIGIRKHPVEELSGRLRMPRVSKIWASLIFDGLVVGEYK